LSLFASVACTPPPSPLVACGQFTLQGVAQSATGQVFVVGVTNAYGVKAPKLVPTQGLFVASVGTTGTVDWIHTLPYEYATSLALDRRADSGPVVIGGGAAATHYDDAGDIALTVGYPGQSGALAAVTSDDRIVVADNKSVRAFGGGGQEWALALPVNVIQVTLLTADRGGGVWLGGGFTGAHLPPEPADLDAVGFAGAFLMHLDRGGAQIGGLTRPSSSSEWITFVKGSVSADPSAAASLIVAGLYQGALSDLMLTPSPYGNGGVIAAFDSGGGIVWTHPIADRYFADASSLPFVVPEASGTFLVLTPQFSAPPDPVEIGIAAARWDASGQEIASTTTAVASLSTNWTAGPAGDGDGAIVTGQAGATCSTIKHLLLHVGGAAPQFQPLPFMLDQGQRQPRGNP
jgi:hypothetical protein